jgi:adenylate kinase family enzyme
MKILIMGLSGSGKTTLAKELADLLVCAHVNADEVRKEHNDWDFSGAGRLRQAHRIKVLIDKYDVAVCDFIAPQPIHRHIVDANITIWMDTVKSSKYKDTDVLFEPPLEYNHRITEKNASKWAQIIYKDINNGT